MARRRNRKAKLEVIKQDSADREDDYANRLTGIGDYQQDKVLGGTSGGLPFLVTYLTNREVEDRWRGSDLGGRIVEAIPDEMTREGWEISIQPSEDKAENDTEEPDHEDALPPEMLAGMAPPEPTVKPIDKPEDDSQEIIEELDGLCDELGLHEAITVALQYERAYGGAAVLIGADDGVSDLTKPLAEETIREIRWLNVFSGGIDGECRAWSFYRDPRSPKYGQPEIYQIRNDGVPFAALPVPGASASPDGDATKNMVFYVHESRLIVFPGVAVSRRRRVERRGWGDSIFMRIDNVLSQYSQTWGGVANLMSQFHQDVLKMSGASIGMAGGDKAGKGNPLTRRARLIQQTKSVARMLVIDAEEEFERLTASLAGVDAVLQQFNMRLAGAADMPVDLLFSSQNSGALNKGDSTVRLFYDRIASRQRRYLLPRLKRFYRLLFLSQEGPTQGEEPERWNIKFNPLYQLTDLEQSTLRKTVAETDQIYINAGVLSPEEVAASAYGGSEWSMERTIDFEGRQKMAEQDAKDKEEHAANMEKSATEMQAREERMAKQGMKAKPPGKLPPGK